MLSVLTMTVMSLSVHVAYCSCLSLGWDTQQAMWVLWVLLPGPGVVGPHACFMYSHTPWAGLHSPTRGDTLNEEAQAP